jgi:hypothetical protein
MIIYCDAWEDDHELADLAEVDPTPEALLSLASKVRESEDVDSLVDPLWRLLWTMRRLLWRDLILAGRASVGFEHDHETGVGKGPVVCLGVPAPGDAPLDEWGQEGL